MTHADTMSQVEAFAAIHCGAPSRRFVANLDTRLELLRAGELAMPASVNDGDAASPNAWVCSPQTAYCDYAREELRRHLHPLLAAPLALVCGAYGAAMRRARIDRAVAVNNWMLSTNLYPDLDERTLDALLAQVLARWPDHAVWLRSLNGEQNAAWLAALEARGFALIPSRQVYLFAPRAPGDALPVNLARDLRLLRNTPLRRVAQNQFGEGDYARVAQLYAALYIDKYSRLNPQYTEHFMRAWHAAGLLELHGFKDDDGILQAVVGTVRQGGTITAPVVGYNRALPVKAGLYRLLMATVLEQGTLRGLTVNLSAGAAQFKRLRGGRPVIEYSAVLADHLPAGRRRVIALLRALTTSLGLPIMKRFEL